mmetsp:Transcript_18957/g.23035  ORF Transcript_18957/g.23035 Transcript_18957/m.23035 type:complete len:109 (-) Transcript_18957:12-338(-)
MTLVNLVSLINFWLPTPLLSILSVVMLFSLPNKTKKKKRDHTNNPYRVRIGPCGWEGRFLTTVLAARAAVNKPSLSWTEPYLSPTNTQERSVLKSQSRLHRRASVVEN